MKKNITLTILFLMLISVGTNAQNVKPEILGTWEITSSKINGVNINLKNIIKMKLITSTYFTWFSCSKDNRITRNSVGGTCSFDGQKYTENIEFVGVGSTDMLHKKHIFDVKITGNKMHMTGTLANKDKIDEVWTRVDGKKKL